jgi:hypothetical protein
LTGCGLIGAVVFVISDRTLARRTGAGFRSIGIPAFAAAACLFGLRLLNLLFLLLGTIGLTFRATVVFAVLLALGSGYLLYRFGRKTASDVQDPNLTRSLVWRREIALAYAIATAFGLALAMAAIAAPLSSWDLFTHWLVVPHEILRQNQMAYLFPYSRTVAPNYPTHQVLLGAIAMLSSGRRDGITNGFANIFLLLGIFAVIEACWLVVRSRFLAVGAVLAVLAIAGCQPDVFGFFYGDALVIATISCVCLGIVYRLRYRSRSSPTLTWVLVTMPLMTKGIGLYSALLGATILLGIEGITALRKGASPWARAWRGLLIFAGLAVVEVALPRFLSRNVVTNYHVPRIGLHVLSASPVETLGGIWSFLVGTKVTILRILLIISLVAPLLGLIRFRRWRRTGQRWIAIAMSVFALGVAAVLAVAILHVPEVKDSLPRYATMLGPIIAVLACVGLAALGLAGRVLALPLVALAASTLLGSDIPAYVKKHTTWSIAEMAKLPRKHEEYEKDWDLYDSIKRTVDPVGGRVFVVVPDKDEFTPYRMGFYFAVVGIKAKLLSKVKTCTAAEMDLAGRVQRWIMTEHALTPPPVEVDFNKDFVVFPKAVTVAGQVWKGLTTLESLQRAP